MKHILRKVCLLSSAALVALGLSAPMASAAAPTSSTLGRLYGPASIAKGTLTFTPDLTTPELTYTGSAQQLITALNNQVPAGATLYLRVADMEEALPSEGTSWVQYENVESLANDALKRTNVGAYYVYYHVDGGSNFNDISTIEEPQEP